METIEITKANDNDIDQLTKFRIEQFQTAKEFKVINTDDFSILRDQVYIVRYKNQIVSTMEYDILNSIEELESKRKFICPRDIVKFKAMHLSKGATLTEYRKIGLNSLIRRLMLKEALKQNDIKSLIGCVYENAPRFNLLKKLGYSVHEIVELNNSLLSYSKLYLVCLDRKFFTTAIDILDFELNSLEKNFKVEISFG